MKSASIMALAITAGLLSACIGEIKYYKTAETITIDPVTHHTIRTTQWEYDDGYQTTTVVDITGGDVEARRAEPQRRFVQFGEP